MKRLLTFTKNYRIILSRVLGAFVVLLILFSDPLWRPAPITKMAFELLAFILVLFATFGRLWALSYISGHKTKDLITEGPYSMMRNPLYFFSLSGTIGIGIVTSSILLTGLIIIIFSIYYPLVIRAEEEHLSKIHGEAFYRYCSEVPSFIPKISLYREPVEYSVNARLFRRAFFSVMWFPLLFLLLLFIGRLHASSIVPALLTIP
jgi:protein-S-isoprenylcysteine O-methyltransferase Ste14